MKGEKFFRQRAKIARMPVYKQVMVVPFTALKLFLIKSLLRLLGLSLSGHARTFWGQRIKGYFLDPTFAFLYLHGFSDEGLTHILISLIKKDMCVFDIGAHIGYETLLASERVGSNGKVFSFEPTASTFHILTENLAGHGNVVANNTAVWSKSGILNFFDYGESNSGLNGVFEPRTSKSRWDVFKPKGFRIISVSLDDFSSIYGVLPDIVKIDAESAEYDILVGMKKILRTKKPAVIIEIGDMPAESGKTARCINFLEGFGYSAYEYSSGKIRKHVTRDSYLSVYDNLLFTHK